MHGRLKVKTTAEQQEEKRKEREKKSKAFLSGMKQVFENRGKAECNELVLSITEKLLSGNPDVYTLWNVRKEIFLQMKGNSDDVNSRFHTELRFLENCLRVNPKSYGVWNQRRFVMLNIGNPNWHEELGLCNLFLKYDERNFHCWDYRRFVVKQSQISADEEFKFTTEKIIENFSNYSAWHNRSKLLPLIKPDPLNTGKVEEAILLKEFELVQNAFFTDPNDQSAWFYQRWLLGRKELEVQLLSLTLKRTPPCLIASFSQPVTMPAANDVLINDRRQHVQWKSSEISHSYVWHTNLEALPSEDDISLQISFLDIKTCPKSLKLTLGKEEDRCSLCWTKDNLSVDGMDESLFSDMHTDAKTSVLENELESCKILLEEEPENKWTMLTIVYLMQALDGGKYMKETEQLLVRLIKVDEKREGYYKDIRSKFRVENEIQKLKREQNYLEYVDLSGKDLTCFAYGQYFTSCKSLNLGSNYLTNASFCSKLIGLESLDLSNNPLNSANVSSIFPWEINIVI